MHQIQTLTPMTPFLFVIRKMWKKKSSNEEILPKLCFLKLMVAMLSKTKGMVSFEMNLKFFFVQICKKFRHLNFTGFLPNVPIKVRILSMIKEDESNHHLNPYLYTIEVTHGPQNWMIKKRYKHFFKLHNSIRFQFVDNEPKDENKVKMYRVTQTKIYFFIQAFGSTRKEPFIW